MSTIDLLRRQIDVFESIYVETGAAAEMNLRNPETGDPSNVQLVYVRASKLRPAGLYVSIQQGPPIRLREAPPAVMARAARHLPEFGEELDGIARQIAQVVDGGVSDLGTWLDERGVFNTALELKRAACPHTGTRPIGTHLSCIECGVLLSLDGNRVRFMPTELVTVTWTDAEGEHFATGTVLE